uniref:Uncharacterized protein n=1 Tax=Physcomitrium patens TaxID=3218 RepID=A0A2K1JYV3_PHYPA|nr:hypothetical protein PHYPA_013827 [Physcomitrium patens]
MAIKGGRTRFCYFYFWFLWWQQCCAQRNRIGPDIYLLY